MKLLNAFSINMLEKFPCGVFFESVTLSEVKEIFSEEPPESCVGHADTAALFSSLVGVPVAANRVTVCLKKDEVAVIGQYRGPRLPEGATALPEGATVEWFLVTTTPNITKVMKVGGGKSFGAPQAIRYH